MTRLASIVIVIIAILFIIGGCSFAQPPIIKEKKWYWPLESSNPDFALTIGGIIYVPEGTLETFTTPGSVYKQALLLHEQHHAKRQQEFLFLPHALAMFFSKSFVWEEEKAAYTVQIQYLRSKGIQIDKKWLLTMVLDPTYRDMVSKEEAEQWVNELLK